MSSSTILQIRYILWWHFLGFHIWKARENKLVKLNYHRQPNLTLPLCSYHSMLHCCTNEMNSHWTSVICGTFLIHHPSYTGLQYAYTETTTGSPRWACSEVLQQKFCMPVSLPSYPQCLSTAAPAHMNHPNIDRSVQTNNHFIFFFSLLLINVSWTHKIWSSPFICIQSDLSNILCRIWRAHFLHFHHGKSTLSSSSTALVCSGTGLSATARTISIHWENASREIKSSGSEYWRSKQTKRK